MASACSHLDTVADVTPSSSGCEDCLRTGGRWVHLRLCMSRGLARRSTSDADRAATPSGSRSMGGR